MRKPGKLRVEKVWDQSTNPCDQLSHQIGYHFFFFFFACPCILFLLLAKFGILLLLSKLGTPIWWLCRQTLGKVHIGYQGVGHYQCWWLPEIGQLVLTGVVRYKTGQSTVAAVPSCRLQLTAAAPNLATATNAAARKMFSFKSVLQSFRI